MPKPNKPAGRPEMNVAHDRRFRYVRFSASTLCLCVASAGAAVRVSIDCGAGSPPIRELIAVAVALTASVAVCLWMRTPGIAAALAAPFCVAAACTAVVAMRSPVSDSCDAFSRAKLRAIGVALCSYYEIHGRFPSAQTTDHRGKPLYGWRGSISGFLEIRGFDPTKRWDAPANAAASAAGEAPFHSTCDPSPAAMTSYLAVVGPDAAWRDGQSRTLAEFADPATAISVVECPQSGTNWAQPRDIAPAAAAALIRNPAGRGANVLFADGHVEFVSRDVPEHV